MAAMVVGAYRVAARREEGSDMTVAAGVLAQPVHDDDAGHCRAGGMIVDDMQPRAILHRQPRHDGFGHQTPHITNWCSRLAARSISSSG